MKLDDYNSEHTSKMNLIFFDQCISHILRISRVLRTPRGNAMLIGVGGSGKQSLTKISSFMLEYGSTLSIEITKGYKSDNFHDFIKDLFKITGIGGKKKTFLFVDSQIIFESFLEDINNILNSGEVPNLWALDEKDQLLGDMRPVCM